ncbi:MAG: dihydrodipicolinate synthase family protein, partial [Gemmatimonadaceae bacterium]
MTDPIRGAGTAIVTPFTPNGQLDEYALRRFVAWQVEQGIDYLVP